MKSQAAGRRTVAPGRPRRPRSLEARRPARLGGLGAVLAVAALLLGSTGCGDGGDSARPASTASPTADSGAPTGPDRPAYTGPTDAPAAEAFYRPPTPLPAGRPGDLLWFREVEPAGRLAPLPVQVFQVLYLSTTAVGEPNAVSGTVLVPDDADASSPVLGYAVGTHGLADRCAPSKAVADGSDYSLADLAAAVDRGWVVAITDYEGLGTPGDHTYAVGPAEGHAVLDAVRAATRLPEARVAAEAPVGLWGYSQGGGAVGWAGELAAAYAPELNLVGIAGGGVPADLAEVSRTLAAGTSSGLIYLAAVGLDAAYPDLDLDSYLTDAGQQLIDELRAGCLDAISLFTDSRTSDFTTTDPMTSPRWQARLGENQLGSAPPDVPVFLYHATFDTTVAFAQGERLMRTYCAAGADVTWLAFPGDHVSGIVRQADALSFLDDRFAGRPTHPTC